MSIKASKKDDGMTKSVATVIEAGTAEKAESPERPVPGAWNNHNLRDKVPDEFGYDFLRR